MTTYSIPETWPLQPGDDLDAAKAWCAEQGINANQVYRTSFQITPGVDGDWWATGHLFDLDEHGKRIVLDGAGTTATFAKTPFTIQVKTLPSFVVPDADNREQETGGEAYIPLPGDPRYMPIF